MTKLNLYIAKKMLQINEMPSIVMVYISFTDVNMGGNACLRIN